MIAFANGSAPLKAKFKIATKTNILRLKVFNRDKRRSIRSPSKYIPPPPPPPIKIAQIFKPVLGFPQE